MSQDPASTESPVPKTAAPVTSRLLAMPAATAVLFLLAHSLLDSPCWSLFFLAAIIAWPIWHYQQEYLLFRKKRSGVRNLIGSDQPCRRLYFRFSEECRRPVTGELLHGKVTFTCIQVPVQELHSRAQGKHLLIEPAFRSLRLPLGVGQSLPCRHAKAAEERLTKHECSRRGVLR